MGNRDFTGLKQYLQNRSDSIVREIFPNGKQKGREYSVANLQGDAGNSVSFNLDTGLWGEFGDGPDGPRGSDIISLYAAKEGISQADAYDQLSERYGFVQSNGTRQPSSQSTSKMNQTQKKNTLSDEEIEKNFTTKLPSKYEQKTTYHKLNEKGEFITAFYVYRRPGNSTRKGVPYWPYHHKGTDGFLMKWLEKGRPPLGLKRITNSDKTLLIVEGEKVARTALKELPEYEVTTWAGGSAHVLCTNYDLLMGRSAILISDADDAGRKAMGKLGDILSEGGGEIKVVMMPGEDGRDIHDVIVEEGVDVARELLAAAELHKPTIRQAEQNANLLGEEISNAIVIEGKFAGRDAESLSTALSHIGFDIRFNNRSKEEEIRNNNNDKPTWGKMNARTKKYVRELILKNCQIMKHTKDGVERQSLYYGREKFEDELSGLLYHSECDPFLEWIEELPEWDGIERIDSCLDDLFGVDKTPLNMWASKFCFIGPIQRAYEPGALFRQLPVLIGKGSMGKTAFTKEVLPPEHPDWFSQGLNLADDDKKRVEACLGAVVVEIAEMAGSTKAELDSMKNFITRIDDGKVRLAYARGTEPLLRRFIFIGTADRPDCLPNDPAGNVRFVPVVLAHGGNVEKYMGENREQLWAEALHRYRNGEKATMPRELAGEQKLLAEQHRNKDEYLESKLEIIEDTTKAVTGWALAEMMDEHTINSRLQRKLTSTMISRGWEVRPTDVGSKRNLSRWFFVPAESREITGEVNDNL